MKHTRKICYTLTAVLLMGIWTLSLNFADEVDQAQIDALSNQMSDAQSNAAATKDQLAEKKSELSELESQIKELEGKIYSQQSTINSLSSEINATENQIRNAQAELAQAELEIQEQDDDMGQRLRTMYKQGETSMLEVLLTSESVSEFMSNIYMAQKIMDSDIELLEAMQEQYELIEQKKASLETMQANLQKQKEEQEAQRRALEEDKNSVNAMKQEVAADAKELEKQVDAFNKEANRLAEQIRSLTNPAIEYEGGTLLKPVSSARETSQFGYRLHPILKVNKLHTGLDYGVSTGTPIKAAASGNVITAGWNNSYGYVVMIDHGVIDGQSMVTVYAHNSSLQVSPGQWVERGQTISLSGSTGQSTGPHLHFEVRINGTHVNPKLYL